MTNDNSTLLTEEERQNRLKKVNNEWDIKNSNLKRTFEFDDFTSALNFVNRVGEIAEKENHHPNINIHDYKMVTISLTTHESGGLTTKDFKVASDIQKVVTP